jgi:hypothetical protein
MVMNEKPMIFSTDEVRAILGGTKTQKRIAMKPQPENTNECFGDDYFEIGEFMTKKGSISWHKDNAPPQKFIAEKFSRYQPGDVLWVRETWNKVHGQWSYKADFDDDFEDSIIQAFGSQYKAIFNPSTKMPREAARLFLKVTDVRVERLNDIRHEDILAEGIKSTEKYSVEKVGRVTIFDRVNCKNQFEDLWDSRNAKRGFGWTSNPFVWVVEFERIKNF